MDIGVITCFYNFNFTTFWNNSIKGSKIHKIDAFS